MIAREVLQRAHDYLVPLCDEGDDGHGGYGWQSPKLKDTVAKIAKVLDESKIAPVILWAAPWISIDLRNDGTQRPEAFCGRCQARLGMPLEIAPLFDTLERLRTFHRSHAKCQPPNQKA